MKRLTIILLSLLINSTRVVQTSLVTNTHCYCIILAGGSGERIWPISRKYKPKQFVSINNKETLLEQTINRIEKIIPFNNIWVCTSQDYVQQIQDIVGNRIGNIVVEPVARNTAPAILLSCLQLQAVDPESVVIFVPADAYISAEEGEKFSSYLVKGIHFTQQHDHIAVLGLKPKYPATGYGYIEFCKDNLTNGLAPVTKFHEKPSYEVAQKYVSSGMLWNLGMFCGKTAIFINEFKRWAPNIYQTVSHYFHNQECYEMAEKTSIDYAVIEKSNNIWVLPSCFSWFDIGNIDVFLSLKSQQGLLTDKLVSINATNNLVDVSDCLVALLGVDSLCVVQTDDVLLIAQKKELEHIKTLIAHLKEKGFHEYL